MKRYLFMTIVMSMCFCLLPASAAEPIKESVPGLSDEELMDLYDVIYDELVKRGIKDDTTLNFPEGKYIVGTDILPGRYLITCTSTSGDELVDLYSSLGNMLDSLDEGDTGYGDTFESIGGAMGAMASATISILGDYGTVLKSYNMKKDETVQVTLEENSALEIKDGSCTLHPLE